MASTGEPLHYTPLGSRESVVERYGSPCPLTQDRLGLGMVWGEEEEEEEEGECLLVLKPTPVCPSRGVLGPVNCSLCFHEPGLESRHLIPNSCD